MFSTKNASREETKCNLFDAIISCDLQAAFICGAEQFVFDSKVGLGWRGAPLATINWSHRVNDMRAFWMIERRSNFGRSSWNASESFARLLLANRSVNTHK